MSVQKIYFQEEILAIIVKAEYQNSGINFITPQNFSQQLGYMFREKGYQIAPHIHRKIKREIHNTQEVLILKKGKVKINFYNDEKLFLESAIIQTGDIVLLASGGHGFEMIEDSEIFEVKQGPYLAEDDKEKF
jgi:hypothetical protein